MKIITFCIIFFICLYTKAQIGTYEIPVYTTYLDFNDTEGTETKLSEATASIGKMGLTLNFGGFNAYVFTWRGEYYTDDKGIIHRKAIDLCSGREYNLMFCKGNLPYEYVLEFTLPSERMYVFPLVKKND